MKEKIIPYTNGRYTITSDGIIYSNYRYRNNGEKEIKKTIYSKFLMHNCAVISIQYGKWSKTNKPKITYVNTLMINAFNLKKPDKFHFYDIKFKNGNVLDNSLDNLEWRIRCNDNMKFYPQPYYNKKGDITSKCCLHCGKIKDISFYVLQPVTKEAHHPTYKNKCKSCIYLCQRKSLKLDKVRYAKAIEHSKNYAKSESGITYYKQYRIDRYKKAYDEINNHYISSCLKILQKELTPELKTIFISKTNLKRKLESHVKEN